MPLFVDGTSFKDFVTGDAIYKNAIKIKGLAARTAALASSPVMEFPEGSPVLYVGEKEVCTAVPSTSRFEWVATDDGTTCVMVAVWRKGDTSRSGIAHVDSKATAKSLKSKLIAPLAEASRGSSEDIEVIIAGGCWSPGYAETCHTSTKMVFRVLESLNESELNLHLRALLVLKENPAKGLPLCMGLALNTRTGEARRAHCVTHGPLFPVRYLYLLSTDSGTNLCPVYDTQKDLYAIPPPTKFSIIGRDKALKFKKLSDEELVNNSTSPECETPRFSHDIRSAADVVLSGSLEKYFPDKKMAYFDEKGNRINF